MNTGFDDGTGDGRLTAMFRAAASEAAAGAPAPGFDHAGVVAASRRATARRRSAIAGGALTVLVVAGGGVAVATPAMTSNADTSVAAGGAGAAREEAGAPPAALSAPEPASPGSGRAGPAAPLGPADPSDCVNKQDPALRALLEAALPEVRDADEAPTTMECRPGGGREVNLEVVDGAATGLLSVVYSAPGAPVQEQGLPVGWVRAGARTTSGGFVSVTTRSAADSGAVPFADRVDAVAAELALQL
ncbi:hypothetical protein [Pseudonocardia sp. H11422]|uniref:hypothetical protein n=1 Tax=Pseudonocardia sp. H11422 TaxID=2835866 RepID=UPI001BDDADF6|nr:hypothetical protein [Pseudonocardia sp. H11422]